jgi:hypothetical protein
MCGRRELNIQKTKPSPFPSTFWRCVRTIAPFSGTFSPWRILTHHAIGRTIRSYCDNMNVAPKPVSDWIWPRRLSAKYQGALSLVHNFIISIVIADALTPQTQLN